MAYWLLKQFSRTKKLDTDYLKETNLSRCLGVFDLMALGIGSTLGAGIYVLAGQVARTQAGPAVVISFLIAAMASVLSGLCYAEFGARIPKTGSAYTYCYISVGELWAFVIGWNMILENMIGAASVGKAWSQYFDAILNSTISDALRNNVGEFDVPWLGEYPDFFAFALLIVVTAVNAIGVKMSSVVTSVLTVVNLIVIAFIIGAGCFYVDGSNWTSGKGFFPYGASGVLSGAATCFYAFVGFDIIATSGEETRNPGRTIPIAILFTLLVCFLAYFGVSAIITLMEPYYKLTGAAPLAEVFAQRGLPAAKYIIAVGAMCGLTASMMGSIFPLPRVIFAMARDGLLFAFLGIINTATKTPVYATLIAGFLTAILAMLLDLQQLVEMMSIGTLMAYALVAICVLVLRYQPGHLGMDKEENKDFAFQQSIGEKTELMQSKSDQSMTKYMDHSDKSGMKRFSSADAIHASDGRTESTFTTDGDTKTQLVINEVTEHPPEKDSDKKAKPEPSLKSHRIAVWSIIIAVILLIALCAHIIFATDYIVAHNWWAILLTCVIGAALCCFVVLIAMQPQNAMILSFKVPFVPFIPVLSIFINVYLMLKLSVATWIRFAVWMVIGLAIYLFYGLKHSSENDVLAPSVSSDILLQGEAKLQDAATVDEDNDGVKKEK
ncbi:high affinity cationic amino acid transporter 1-like [Saccoglossus kowalevskii]|uniref:High affinity cationic amino acid transporter 1-like n=1 Tax=Saccoglossus kowalevskii TaxID=10224 RepID=A0ABM0GUC9_SACKO|nr:PREDICTED: high affinity cationic amino acid transporter 1-like [Saccoglossus kowalevskii]